MPALVFRGDPAWSTLLPHQKGGWGVRRDTPLAEGRDLYQPKCSIGLREMRGETTENT